MAIPLGDHLSQLERAVRRIEMIGESRRERWEKNQQDHNEIGIILCLLLPTTPDSFEKENVWPSA